MIDSLLTTEEVADLLKVAEVTLRKWRLNGLGPRFTRCGASIRYSRPDLDAWILSRTVASTSEALEPSGHDVSVSPDSLEAR